MIEENKNLGFGDIFRILLMQSKLIIGIVFLFTITWAIFYIKAERVYNIESLVQVEPTSAGSAEEVSSLIYGGGNDSVNLNNQITLYEARSNIEQLINIFSLNLIPIEHKRSELEIESFSMNDDLESTQNKIQINFINDDEYIVTVGSELKTEPIKVGKYYADSNLIIKINNISSEERVFNYSYLPTESLINLYKAQIRVTKTDNTRNFYWTNAGLIRISIDTSDPDLGIEMIDALNKIFITNNLEFKSEKARKAIEFIDNRLSNIENLVDDSKKRLNTFLQTNSSVDVDLETRSILESLSRLQSSLIELELEEAKISGSYTTTNPLYINLQSQKKLVNQEITEIEEKIKDLPPTQQEFIDLFRDVEVSQELYKELLNRKLNFSIQEASTLGNIRVIDSAYNNGLVSPSILGGFFIVLFSGFLGLIIALLRGLYFTPFTNPAEIFDKGITNAPLIGILPMMDEDDNKTYIQGMESLHLNIRQIQKEGNTIVVTSPTPENGKSHTCRNLAKHLAAYGKKVLIMDCDYKRGDQHKDFKIDRLEKVKIEQTFLNKEFESLKFENNLYVIPRLKGIENSFQWIDSPSYRKIIEIAKEEFDYVIIDSPPLLSVSDASLLLNIADLSILLCRHNLTKPSEVRKSIEIGSQLGVNFDGLIYNAYQKPKGYYGYYQYYGNYSYKYYADKYLYESYDYENPKK